MTKRVAFVTGGNGGIGSAICRELANQGNVVVAGYFPPEKESAEAWQQQMQAQGIEIALAAIDVTSYEDCERAVTAIANEHGPVEILVNCAGITRDGTLKKMPEANWKAVISTNLDSAFNVTRHVINGMLDKGWGRIVNIASAHGLRASPYKAAYVSAKHGILGLTKTVALEFAEARVAATVNAICPGYVHTPLVDAQIADQMKAHKMGRQEVIEKVILDRQPTREFATVEQIGGIVSFLCSPAADQVTGTSISVDGGWTAM